LPLTWDDITSKTVQFIVPEQVDSVFKVSPVLSMVRTKRQFDFPGGLNIQQPIMYAKLKGDSYPRGGTFDTAYVQTDTAMTFNIKNYYVNITLFGTDDVIAMGSAQAMKHIDSKMVNAAQTMAELLATDMYLDGQGTNSGVGDLDGFDAALDSGGTFTSYGQITRSLLSANQNEGINGYTASVPTLSLTAIQTAYGACWFGNESPDLIVTTQAVWNIFWGKLQPQQRFQDQASETAKAGFRALLFNGTIVTVDQYAPVGKMWFLNTKYVKLYVSKNKKHHFGFTGWKEAQNSDDRCGQYLFSGNLVVTAPRLMGKITGITG
jgi:hypothetical protein